MKKYIAIIFALAIATGAHAATDPAITNVSGRVMVDLGKEVKYTFAGGELNFQVAQVERYTAPLVVGGKAHMILSVDIESSKIVDADNRGDLQGRLILQLSFVPQDDEADPAVRLLNVLKDAVKELDKIKVKPDSE